jgi:hypothetical protein
MSVSVKFAAISCFFSNRMSFRRSAKLLVHKCNRMWVVRCGSNLLLETAHREMPGDLNSWIGHGRVLLFC